MRTSKTVLPWVFVVMATGIQPAAAAGMPQLDFATFPPQLVWLTISFVVLFVVMSKVALPKVGQVLEERQHRIDGNLEKARALKAEADDAARAYEQALAKARSDAQDVIRATGEQMAETAAEQNAELTSRLDGKIKAAEERISAAKSEAVANIRDVAADVAASAAEKLTAKKMDQETAVAAVDAVLGERG
jgi:F-type H+-transporting ATPase subunit b